MEMQVGTLAVGISVVDAYCDQLSTPIMISHVQIMMMMVMVMRRGKENEVSD